MASAFISYKWEDDIRNQWVYRFYNDLRTKKGIDAKIDKFEVGPGDSFIEYMAREIQSCDYFLFIVTPGSVKAVEESRGGVFFELQMGLARQIGGDQLKVIPIYREGSKTPTYLRSHSYVDFRDDKKYDHNLTELARWLNGEIRPPMISKSEMPKPGKPKPVLQESWLRARGELYFACAVVAKASFDGKPLPSGIKEKLGNLKRVKIDSGSFEKVGNEIIFLAYILQEGESNQANIAEVWVKVDKWEENGKGMRLTKDVGAILSESLAGLSG